MGEFDRIRIERPLWRSTFDVPLCGEDFCDCDYWVDYSLMDFETPGGYRYPF